MYVGVCEFHFLFSSVLFLTMINDMGGFNFNFNMRITNRITKKWQQKTCLEWKRKRTKNEMQKKSTEND